MKVQWGSRSTAPLSPILGGKMEMRERLKRSDKDTHLMWSKAA